MNGSYISILLLIVTLTEFASTSTTLSSAIPVPLTDEQKNKAVTALEFSLLKLFGLSKRPRPGRNIIIPQYMIDLYRSQTDDDSDIPSVFTRGGNNAPANTIRSFQHEDVPHLHGCHENDCARVWFNTSYIPQDELLTAAELRIHIARNHTYESDVNKVIKHKFQVFEIMKPKSRFGEPLSRLIDVQDVIVQNSSWVSFDVHPAVLKWKNTPRQNHGLEVRLVSKNNVADSPLKHVRLRRSAELAESEWDIQKPLLVTYTDDGKASRTKRSSSSKKGNKRKRKKCEKGKKGKQCRKDRKKNRKNRKDKNKDKTKKNPPAKRRKGHKDLCKRRPLNVNFEDVGWNDWIVAPLGYEAYYCDGNCPFPLTDNLNATNHAIVQTLVNSVDLRAAPTACCVPTSLSSISMLYLDEFDKVILKQYDEMVVEGCGCR